ncbi:CCA tRNA nucleotidyltransferase [Ruminiclostridium cellobioparum]|uniref:CCA tRNA nucleotidyltransferase n=1 Tax=Ruminiclostridium cellobioparum TaxID=29355 RepID=UPI000481840F|nr:CCA tRNA nucleotidyltransferase [Ruminiclostridium cellobioparum]
MKKIIYPGSVGYIINKLNEKGFEAFIVGGCVRDSVLGKDPHDWDITTSALPADVKETFGRTYDAGIKHGTVSVAVEDEIFEVTTYRVDGKYSDSRRPDNVSFTASLKEDLARRDFTVNAMAYNYQTGLVDYFEGLQDIKNRQIKAVGNAGARFQEDALRMLRAIRFSAQLGFEIEKNTFDAISGNSGLIKNISRERIREEVDKLLTSQNPSCFNKLYHSGLLEHILPEFVACYHTEQNNPYHIYNVAEHIIRTVESIPKSSILRWTMLLHDIGKPLSRTTDDQGIDHFYGHQEVSVRMADSILNNLRLDKLSIKKILTLVRYHDVDIFDTGKSIRKVLNKVGEDLFLSLLEVQRADAMGQNPVYLDKRLVKLDNIKRIYKEIKDKGQCLSLSDMAVNGDDLISLGMEPGRKVGEMLGYLFDRVLENPELNDKEKLIELAKQLIQFF